MDEGVAVIGSNQRLTLCNEAFSRALEMEGAPWEGRLIVDVIRQSENNPRK